MPTRTVANLGIAEDLSVRPWTAAHYDKAHTMLGDGSFLRTDGKTNKIRGWTSTDFATQDAYATSLGSRNMRYLPNLHYFWVDPVTHNHRYRLPTEGGGNWGDWDDYVDAFCDRFAPGGTLDLASGSFSGIQEIENWNEPNTPTGNCGGRMTYAALYQIITHFCSTVRAHPLMGSAKVIGLCLGGLNAWPYLDGLMNFVDGQEVGGSRAARLGAFWARMDVLSVHIYQGRLAVGSPGTTSGSMGTINTIGRVRDYLNNNGGSSVRLAMTEGGVSGQDPVPHRGGTDRLPNRYNRSYKTGTTIGTVPDGSKAGSEVLWEGPDSPGRDDVGGEYDQATYFHDMTQIIEEHPEWGLDYFSPFVFQDREPAWTSGGDQYPYHQLARGFVNGDLSAKPVFFQYQAYATGSSPPGRVITPAIDTAAAGTPVDGGTSTSATFTWSSTQAGVTYEVSLDGSAFTAQTSPKSYSGLSANADHTFRVRALLDGRYSTPATFTWHINASSGGPITPGFTSGPASGTDTTARFFFASPSPGVTYEARLNNLSSGADPPPFAPVTSPHTELSVPQGDLRFEVRAIDGSGRRSPINYWAWTVGTADTSTKIRYLVELIWDTTPTRAFTIGASTLDGSDVIVGSFGSGTYSDITSDVKSISIVRGKPEKYGDVARGECILELADAPPPTATPDEVAAWKGKYNPENPDGPLYGKLLPMRGVRVSAIYQGHTERLFQGWTRRLRDRPFPGDYSATLECSDTFLRLADDSTSPIVIPNTGPTTVGAVIGIVLDAIGFTEPTMRDLDEGSSIKDFTADGTLGALNLIRDVLRIDGGVFYISSGGVATYDDANALRSSGALSALAGNLMDYQPGFDVEGITNRVVANQSDNPIWNGGTPLVVEDEASVTEYGPRELSIDSPYWVSESQATSFADRVLRDLAEPLRPIGNVRISNDPAAGSGDGAAVQAMLGRDLNEIVSISDIDVLGVIQSIQHEITEGGLFHFCTWTLTQAPEQILNPFVIGSSTLDGDDVLP